MWWLILEAGGAFFIFVFIVWWTMFSGRKPDQPIQTKNPSDKKDDTQA
jgi:hypothetical protein